MSFTPSAFDAIIDEFTASGFAPLAASLETPLALIDEDDISQPDGMPFQVATGASAPFHMEGLSFICSLRDGGSTIVVHGPEPMLASHMEESFMDPIRCMQWASMAARQADAEVPMGLADGSICPPRDGYICEL